MPKYRFELSQQRTQNWIVEVEAENLDAANDTLNYGFDEDHGFFYADTEGLTVVEDDGPISDYGPLVVDSVVEDKEVTSE